MRVKLIALCLLVVLSGCARTPRSAPALRSRATVNVSTQELSLNQKIVAKGYVSCLMRADLQLDDHRSDPRTIAHAMLAQCFPQFNEMMDAYGEVSYPGGLGRTTDIVRRGALDEAIRLVLIGRKREATSPAGRDAALGYAAFSHGNYEKAEKWWRMGARQGDPNAEFGLGSLYYRGDGVRQDCATAARWYQISAKSGNSRAFYALGILYNGGHGCARRARRAARYFQRSALRGDADAEYYLGSMYDSGDGETKDYKQAADWYRRAADQGVALAQIMLGIMYDRGRGVDRDLNIASFWFEKAANQGMPAAQYLLGAMYFAGKGKPKDLVQGYKWLNLAYLGGNSYAGESLQIAKRVMTSDQIHEAVYLSSIWSESHREAR